MSAIIGIFIIGTSFFYILSPELRSAAFEQHIHMYHHMAFFMPNNNSLDHNYEILAATILKS